MANVAAGGERRQAAGEAQRARAVAAGGAGSAPLRLKMACSFCWMTKTMSPGMVSGCGGAEQDFRKTVSSGRPEILTLGVLTSTLWAAVDAARSRVGGKEAFAAGGQRSATSVVRVPEARCSHSTLTASQPPKWRRSFLV